VKTHEDPEESHSTVADKHCVASVPQALFISPNVSIPVSAPLNPFDDDDDDNSKTIPVKAPAELDQPVRNFDELELFDQVQIGKKITHCWKEISFFLWFAGISTPRGKESAICDLLAEEHIPLHSLAVALCQANHNDVAKYVLSKTSRVFDETTFDKFVQLVKENYQSFDSFNVDGFDSFSVEGYIIPDIYSLISTLDNVYHGNNAEICIKNFLKNFILKETIIYYSVHSCGTHWILVSNYGRVFRGGGITAEIKKFDFWISQANVKILQNMSETLTCRQYSLKTFEDVSKILDRMKKEQIIVQEKNNK